MARTTKPTGTPRKEPDPVTVEGIPHDHGDGDPHHLHRLGDLSHLHDEHGKAILLNERGEPLFDNEGEAADPGAKTEEWGKAEAKREEQREDAAAARRAEIVAAVTDEDRADMERIRAERTDAILPANGQPRPVAVSGAPGSRLADVTSLVSTWTQLGFPVELQDELTQIQIAKLALDSMLEEIIRTRRHSDPALVASLLDAVDTIARARGLVRGGGS